MLKSVTNPHSTTGNAVHDKWERAAMEFYEERDITITPVVPEPSELPGGGYIQLRMTRRDAENLRVALVMLMRYANMGTRGTGSVGYAGMDYGSRAAINDVLGLIKKELSK